MNSLLLAQLSIPLPCLAGLIGSALVAVVLVSANIFKRGTIRVRLLASFVLLTLLPAIVISAVSVDSALRTGQAQVLNQLQSVATLKEGEINGWLEALQLDLRQQVTRDDEMQRLVQVLQSPRDTAEFKALYDDQTAQLKQAIRLSPRFEEMFLIDRDGRVILSTNPQQENRTLDGREFFRQGLIREYVSAPFYSQLLNETIIVAAHPITDTHGWVQGMLAGRVNMTALDSIMSVRTGLGQTGETYLLGQNHERLTSLRFSSTTQSLRSVGADRAIDLQVNGMALYPNYNNQPVIGVYRWLLPLQVVLLAEQSQAEAFQATYTTLVINIGVALIAVLLAVMASLAITRSIVTPLDQLAETASAVAGGDLSRTAQVEREDEVSRLAQAFNSMTAQLRDLIGGLERRVSERTAELAARAEQLDLINQVGRDAISIIELHTLLPHIANLIRDTFGYYAVLIMLKDSRSNELYLSAADTEASRALAEKGLRVGINSHSIVGHVAATNQPIVVDDVKADPRFLYEERLPRTRSELVLPLHVGSKMLGVLDLESAETQTFAPSKVQVLQTLADQIAIAIRNAQLYKAEQDRRQLAEALARTGQALTSSLNLREVPGRILEQLMVVVPYDRGAVMLQEDGGLRVIARRGQNESQQIGSQRIRLAEGDVFHQVLTQGKPLWHDDVPVGAWQPRHGSWLGVPLISQSKAVGIISLTRSGDLAFGADDATMVTTFAMQAAIALENAGLYDEIKRFNEQLEHMVQQRTEELKKAYDALEKLDRTKSDFINLAAHELRTPMTLINGYAQLLLHEPNAIDATTREMVEGILSGQERMHEIVNRLLDVSRIASQAMELAQKPVQVAGLAAQLKLELLQALRERNLTLTLGGLEELPSIEADPDMLYKLFYHLIINAIKFTPDGGSIWVSGRAIAPTSQGQDSVVEIIVRDTGIGIDPGYHEMIFEKFFQMGTVALHSSGRTKFKGGGPGLGLTIAKGIVTAHGGKIWVESAGYDEKNCPGSEFHVCLPITHAS